ncbi:MAG: hypothetical protein ACO1O6_10610 [Bacteroidota bacterium]
MLTSETLKSGYVFIKALTGNSECFNGIEVFPGHGKFCDVYFKSKQENISQSQIDTFNVFRSSFKNYLQEINFYLLNSLSSSEQKLSDQIEQAELSFDVLEVPVISGKYDLVLVCSKKYRQFLIFGRNIDLRVEFKSGKISSIERKKDTTQENS